LLILRLESAVGKRGLGTAESGQVQIGYESGSWVKVKIWALDRVRIWVRVRVPSGSGVRVRVKYKQHKRAKVRVKVKGAQV
jgi:hypothetical protein